MVENKMMYNPKRLSPGVLIGALIKNFKSCTESTK